MSAHHDEPDRPSAFRCRRRRCVRIMRATGCREGGRWKEAGRTRTLLSPPNLDSRYLDSQGLKRACLPPVSPPRRGLSAGSLTDAPLSGIGLGRPLPSPLSADSSLPPCLRASTGSLHTPRVRGVGGGWAQGNAFRARCRCLCARRYMTPFFRQPDGGCRDLPSTIRPRGRGRAARPRDLSSGRGPHPTAPPASA